MKWILEELTSYINPIAASYLKTKGLWVPKMNLESYYTQPQLPMNNSEEKEQRLRFYFYTLIFALHEKAETWTSKRNWKFPFDTRVALGQENVLDASRGIPG